MIRKHRIVIVDDEPNIGSSLRLILEGEGYGVTVCESVAKLRSERPTGRADVYLLDVRLPDGSGLEVLKTLRQEGDPAPVIMISGHGTIQDAIMQGGDKQHEIYDLIVEGKEQYGSQTFDQHLRDLVEADLVSYEVAKAAANNPADFELKMRTLV